MIGPILEAGQNVWVAGDSIRLCSSGGNRSTVQRLGSV